jgi:hypothetical protein
MIIVDHVSAVTPLGSSTIGRDEYGMGFLRKYNTQFKRTHVGFCLWLSQPIGRKINSLSLSQHDTTSVIH